MITATRSGPAAAPFVGLALDIGLPLVAYYALHAAGASDRDALLAATIAAGLRLIFVAIRRRRLTWFATMMLAIFGGGLALAFVGGDARVLLAKDSAGTATMGMVFLASLVGDRPLPLSASEGWSPARARQLESLYREEPAARRAIRITTLGWGVGLLFESVARIPLVLTVPISWAVGLSTAWMIIALAGLVAWNAGYLMHATRRSPALRVLLPGGAQRQPPPPADSRSRSTSNDS